MNKYFEQIENLENLCKLITTKCCIGGMRFHKQKISEKDNLNICEYYISVPQESWIYEADAPHNIVDKIPSNIYEMLSIDINDKIPDFVFESGDIDVCPDTISNTTEFAYLFRVYCVLRDWHTTLTGIYKILPNIGEEDVKETIKELREDVPIKISVKMKTFDEPVEVSPHNAIKALDSLQRMEQNPDDTTKDNNTNSEIDTINKLLNSNSFEPKMIKLLMSGLIFDKWDWSDDGKEIYYISIPENSWVYEADKDRERFTDSDSFRLIKQQLFSLLNTTDPILSPKDIGRELKKFFAKEQFDIICFMLNSADNMAKEDVISTAVEIINDSSLPPKVYFKIRKETYTFTDSLSRYQNGIDSLCDINVERQKKAEEIKRTWGQE